MTTLSAESRSQDIVAQSNPQEKYLSYSFKEYKDQLNSVFSEALTLRPGPGYKRVLKYLQYDLQMLGEAGIITQPAMLSEVTKATESILLGGEGETIKKALKQTINRHDPDDVFRTFMGSESEVRDAWINDDGSPTNRKHMRRQLNSQFFPVTTLPNIILYSLRIIPAPIPTVYLAHSVFPRPMSRFIAPDRFSRALHHTILYTAYQNLSDVDKQQYEVFEDRANLPKRLQTDEDSVILKEAVRTRLLALGNGALQTALLGSPHIQALHEINNPYAIVYTQDLLRPNLVSPGLLRRSRYTIHLTPA